MYIDPDAERQGREIVRQVMARDEEKFLNALDDLASASEDERTTTMGLYLGVSALLVRLIHHNEQPSDVEKWKIAEAVARVTPWEPITAEMIYRYLDVISNPEHDMELSGPGGLMVIFMVAGYLLAWYHQGLGYDSAYALLDRILNHMAAGPDPSQI